jgi:tetratricopeptide (TPR) repeat protein
VIAEDTLGAEHPDVAASLDHLGVLYTAHGKFKAAESHHKRAIAIRRKALGPGHLLVAQSLENYADLLAQTGRETEAKRLQLLAISIRANSARANEPKAGTTSGPKKRAIHILKTKD